MLAFLEQGGGFTWILLGLSILAVGLILDKASSLYLSFRLDEQLITAVLDLMRRGEFGRAQTLCNAPEFEGDAVAEAFAAILKHRRKSRDAMESAVSVVTKKLVPRLQARTEYLSMIGNVSTLLGLLGTIQGLMVSFGALEGAATQGALLASGISTAMQTTFLGLSVAIPCIVAYTVFTNRENYLLDHLDASLQEAMHAAGFERPKVSSVENARSFLRNAI